MNSLTAIVFEVLAAVVLLLLGSIVAAFLAHSPDRSADELLAPLHRTRGGTFRRVAPGRTMLEYVDDTGTVLVGYWKQRDTGALVAKPSLSVRWRPSRASESPEFMLRLATGPGVKTTVSGFQRTASPLRVPDRTFDLFVRPFLSEREREQLAARLMVVLSDARDTSALVALAHLEGHFSVQRQETVATSERTEALLQGALALLGKIA